MNQNSSIPAKIAVAICAALVLGLSVVAAPQAHSQQLRDNVPERYTVQRGDTLWGISAMFLRDPWMWPEVWEANPQIDNPHLIYPGDVIRLVMVNGKPRLRLERGGTVRSTDPGTVRLQPRVRERSLEDAIPTIPLDIIRPFLTRPQVISEHQLDHSPYLMRSVDSSLMSSEGSRIYARGLPAGARGTWTVVRPGEPYVDPDTGDELGYEATYIGEVEIIRSGDPMTVRMTLSRQEALSGDRLIPLAGQTIDRAMQPRAPSQYIEGRIIRRLGGVEADKIGQYHIVALNLGEHDGLEPGHVLTVWRPGKTITDEVAGGKVGLPDERVGELLVFRVGREVSFGLVMRSAQNISAKDYVRTP